LGQGGGEEKWASGNEGRKRKNNIKAVSRRFVHGKRTEEEKEGWSFRGEPNKRAIKGRGWKTRNKKSHSPR